MTTLATDTARPDADRLLGQLKPFQRATVDHAFRRLWTDDDAVDRFLVADEVGLGKTLVAKGVAARAIDHLWEPGRSTTIVYICSNGQIARQNLERLRDLTGGEAQDNADRITLLPRSMGKMDQQLVQLISFTPRTSFRLGHSTGRVEERTLLHWLLCHFLDRRWLLRKGAIDYFADRVGRDSFEDQLGWNWSRPNLDPELVADFEHHVRTADGPLGATLFEDLVADIDLWLKYRKRDHGMRYRRKVLIGELRMAMAHVSVARLSPDLVILDEFQRFKDLFPGATSDEPELNDAQRLAQRVITNPGAKALVLSATPYKMFTLPDEPDGEDHYRDFRDTIGFLAGGERADRVTDHLAAVRRGMLLGTPDSTEDAHRATRTATAELQRVMSRTERLGATAKGDGMLAEKSIGPLELRPLDLESWVASDAIARHVRSHDVFEYWRSSPYPMNLMDPSAYQVQRRVLAAAEDQEPELAALLRAHRRGLLSWGDVQQFREIDLGNSKLRGLVDDAMRRDIWKLSWLPPSLPYVEPGGPFASDGARTFTKRLVFSAWGVVPKAISALFSYEVDRRLSTYAPRHTDGEAIRYDSRRASPLLRFAVSDEKLLNLPHLAVIHPSVALARLGDPLEIARTTGAGLPLDRDRLLDLVTERVQRELDALDLPQGEPKGLGAGWYGVAPYLLDRAFELDRPGLLGALSDTSDDEEGGSRLADHVRFALDPDLHELGPPPDDLARVLAMIGVAGPGVCALRALGCATGGAESLTELPVRRAALHVAEGIRSLFNRPEIMAAVRASTDAGPDDMEGYWHRTLRYCLDGNLQAMLDEYVHTLVDSQGLLADGPLERAEKLAQRIRETASIRTAANEIHDLSAREETIEVAVHRMNSHIAARFGRAQTSDSAEHRETSVRNSYNSPFWPFVLASTSVGQEGLDFHTYSHAVVHWNLPGNPVDLEQREGRVHRYKGHAIRKNVAEAHGEAALAGEHDDPWTAMFDAAEASQPAGSSGMSPFWVYEGNATIERYVPAMPLSRETRRYRRLQRTLGAYRSVMGQPRQDDLIKLLGQDVEWPRIDLTPRRISRID